MWDEGIVSKPLSGRSLLQGRNGRRMWDEGIVSKPLSGRSLLQGEEEMPASAVALCLQTAKRSFTFARRR
jgi:hypothetical protein